jgi:hypothetical protein
MAIGPSFGGFVYFAGAKFLGYSAFVHFLRKKWNDVSTEKPWRTFVIGGTRTLIGVGVGISYGLLFAGIVNLARIQSDAWSLGLFFVFLIPVRLGEWYWLLRIAFKQQVRGSPQIPWSLGWGTSVSFALDAIGVAAAFVMPGGMWVC